MPGVVVPLAVADLENRITVRAIGLPQQREIEEARTVALPGNREGLPAAGIPHS